MTGYLWFEIAWGLFWVLAIFAAAIWGGRLLNHFWPPN